MLSGVILNGFSPGFIKGDFMDTLYSIQRSNGTYPATDLKVLLYLLVIGIPIGICIHAALIVVYSRLSKIKLVN